MDPSLRIRRAEIAAAIVDETGLNEEVIEQVVREFYRRAKADPLLGPVFEERVADWDEHIQTLTAFWTSVALLTGGYHGRPLEKHASLPVNGHHFERWLGIFEATVKEVCTPAGAAYLTERAHRIAATLKAAAEVSLIRSR